LLRQKPGRYILRDNEHTEVIADSLLQPVFCLRAGVRHDAVAPLNRDQRRFADEIRDEGRRRLVVDDARLGELLDASGV
jgi:hypothetical protein